MPITFGRVLLVTGMLASVGAGIVLIRQDMARCAYRIQVLHQKQVRQQEELWSRQMDLARLRVPDALRARLEQMGVQMEAPRVDRKPAHEEDGGARGAGRPSD